jgi:glycosyltransferase involved in cell wall biosynthesis
VKIISTAERPINLLEIIGASIVGGMETYVLRLLERLPQDTFRVTCLCVAEGKLTSQLRDIGCSVHITPITDEPDWQSILLGTSLVRADAIDVIHAHLPNAHSLAGILSRLTDTPAIATIHGRYLSMRDFEVHKLMNTHICVVAKTAYFQALTLGIPSTKLRFIPNGIDTKIFHPAPRSNYLHSLIKIPPEAPLVGFIGRLSPEKGPEMFVRVAQLAHKRLKNCHFVLVGEGPMRRELQDEIDQHDLTGHIHMVGLQRDMTKIYPCLDLVVSTSYSEAMPLVIVEAMASGLPVVATNVGGVVDIVEVGGTGLLKQPGDTEGLANDVVTLMTSNSTRMQMGEAARKRVEEKFDLSGIVAQTAQLLRSLTQGGIKGSDADTAKGYRKARS